MYFKTVYTVFPKIMLVNYFILDKEKVSILDRNTFIQSIMVTKCIRIALDDDFVNIQHALSLKSRLLFAFKQCSISVQYISILCSIYSIKPTFLTYIWYIN